MIENITNPEPINSLQYFSEYLAMLLLSVMYGCIEERNAR